jgi:hypothetical protein
MCTRRTPNSLPSDETPQLSLLVQWLQPLRRSDSTQA